jgi:galactokinase
MKFLTITALSLFSLGAFAEMDLNEKKQKMNSKIDQRIQQMEEARNCINAADSKGDLKDCKHEWKQKKHEQKAQRHEEKKQKEESKQKEEE